MYLTRDIAHYTSLICMGSLDCHTAMGSKHHLPFAEMLVQEVAAGCAVCALAIRAAYSGPSLSMHITETVQPHTHVLWR